MQSSPLMICIVTRQIPSGERNGYNYDIFTVCRRVRFLGYAGVSLVLCVPSFVMSTAAAWKLFQTPRLYMSSRGRTGSSAIPSLSFRSNAGTENEMGTDVRKSADILSTPQIWSTTPSTAHALLDTGRVESPVGDEKPRCYPPLNLSPSSDRELGAAPPALDSPRTISIISATPGPLDETDPYSARYVPSQTGHTHAEYETASSMGWITTTEHLRLSRLSVNSALSKLDSDFPGDPPGNKVLPLDESPQMLHVNPRRESQPLSNRTCFRPYSGGRC
jgi:hypothetical protein